MRTLSLFSGIGGLDLGLERAGFEIVAQCEADPFCRRVLKKHWPDVPCHDDVRTIDPLAYGPLDAIVGGFPCVDISNAGDRAGISAPRSGLYGHLVRCLRVARPRIGILENVAALLGRGMDKVLGDLAAIGYDAEWICVRASDVGAPHKRDRAFIVAHPFGYEQRGKESCLRTLGRMGRVEQPLPWNRTWQSALREFRGMDDGSAYGVDRLDGIRNAVVPAVAELVGRAVMASLETP